MNYSKEELIKLWGNSAKRKAFVEQYKEWGVYVSIPELTLTFYKCDLPDGSIIFVMEHMQENYDHKIGKCKWEIDKLMYLQKGEYFTTHRVSISHIDEHLMGLKQKFLKDKEGGGDV